MARMRLLVGLLSGFVGVNAITVIPSTITTASSYSYTGGASLSSISYSYTYTYTTPTTIWQAPTFPTTSPSSPCTDSLCPSQDEKRCLDVEGVVYGVLCNTLFSGTVITNSGKFMEKDKRSYTGTFEGCTGFCDTYNATTCIGVAYQNGNCLAYAVIAGTFPNSAGGFAAIRLS